MTCPIPRLSKITLNQPNIKKRYGWHLCQILVLTVALWVYGLLGSAFVKAPQNIQWILAFLTPFVKDTFSKVLGKVAMKAADPGLEERKSIKFFTNHFVITRHTVFLAVIIGGVSTPLTSLCIMAIDFAKAMQAGWRIISKVKANPNVDVEGKVKVKH